METERIREALGDQFNTKGHRIVFWHDPDREFEEILDELDLDGVSLLRLDEHPALAVKVRLEQEDPTGRYLLYAPFDPPAPDQDWLLDMRLYSASFSADRASMLLVRPRAHPAVAPPAPGRASQVLRQSGPAGAAEEAGQPD